MTKFIDRSQEKMALAKELGLSSYVRAKETETKLKKEIEELTSMQFKVITEDEISKMLRKPYWHGVDRSSDGLQFWTFIVLLVGTLSAFLMPVAVLTKTPDLFTTGAYFKLVGVIELSVIAFWGLGVLFTCVRVAQVCKMPLNSWGWELPYGALLAVKEAKSKGLEDFEVYYPSRNNYYDRILLKLDPVLTSKKAGKLLEIFSWDEGKIYE